MDSVQFPPPKELKVKGICSKTYYYHLLASPTKPMASFKKRFQLKV